MTPIRIRSLGVVGGFGCGREALKRAMNGDAPTPGVFSVLHGGNTVEVPALRADLSPLEEFLPKRTLRRVDTFGRLALLGAHLALHDAGLLGSDLKGTALVLASSYGASTSTFALIDSVIQDGDPFSSPIHFANSLHNSAAANLSILLGLRGTCLTVSQGGLSVPSAFLSAASLLHSGKAERVLVGAVEELSELVAYLYLRSNDVEGKVPPSAVPSEGAAFFLLEKGEGPGLAILNSIEMSSKSIPMPQPDREERVILGEYASLSTTRADPPQMPPACLRFEDRFGLSPAGPAFDLAAACVLLESLEKIACFSIVPEEGCGLIRLDRISQ